MSRSGKADSLVTQRERLCQMLVRPGRARPTAAETGAAGGRRDPGAGHGVPSIDAVSGKPTRQMGANRLWNPEHEGFEKEGGPGGKEPERLDSTRPASSGGQEPKEHWPWEETEQYPSGA